jgi:hypothetical protein
MPKQKNIPLTDKLPISTKLIERRIHLIRGQQVMLDKDLAELYQVPTKVLNQAVRRNKYRFPNDFMFQLNAKEALALRSQIVTLDNGRGKYFKYAPFVFTDYGVAMLSSILHSERAIQMNIMIMKAFINLRVMLEEYKGLAKEVAKIKGTQDLHTQVLTRVVKNLKIISSPPKVNLIGFRYK